MNEVIQLMYESPYSLQVTERQQHYLEQRLQLLRNVSDFYLPNVPAKVTEQFSQNTP